MYVTMNRISVDSAHRDAFERRFRQRAGLVDQAPGFVRNLVLRPEEEDGVYIVLTMWRSREDFVAWTRSEDFRKAHARAAETPKDMFRAPGRLETFYTVSDSDQEVREPK